MNGNTSKYFDVGYGIASAAITNGTTIVSTTASIYHGFVVVASSAGGLFKVYDSTGTTSGNLIDAVLFAATVSTQNRNFQPVQARKGLVVSVVTGTGIQGSIFFVPKG